MQHFPILYIEMSICILSRMSSFKFEICEQHESDVQRAQQEGDADERGNAALEEPPHSDRLQGSRELHQLQSSQFH